MRSKQQAPGLEDGKPVVEMQATDATLQSGAAARGRKRFGEGEIEQFIRLEQSGIDVSALCARYGFTLAEFFRWKARYTTGAPSVIADELKALRTENQLLRDLVASLLSNARRERPQATSSGRHQGNSGVIGSRNAACGAVTLELRRQIGRAHV